MGRAQGQVAVVTGAASGIGAALARALVAEGAVVALADVQEERVAALADALRAGGATASAHAVDVGDAAAVDAFARAVEEQHGNATLLFNNAGITIYGTFEEHSAADFEAVMRVNLGGVVHGCRAFLPQLRRPEQAMIVNISSVFGLVGIPGQSAYCTSKYAVRGFSDALREELRGTGVGVLCVHPGGVATDIVRTAHTAAGLAPEQSPLPRVAKLFERHAMSPDRAARQILRATLRRRSRLLVAREAPVMDALARLAPVGGLRMAAGLIHRLGTR